MVDKNDLIKVSVIDYELSFGVNVIYADGVKDYHIINKCNIHTIEDDTSITWFDMHDLYKTLRYVYYDERTKTYYLHRSELYNKSKLKSMQKDDKFKKQKYSFFNYGLLDNIVNGVEGAGNMSGLF